MQITDFLFFLKMGTSPNSSVFSTVGSRTSTPRRGSATGSYTRDYDREAQRGNKTGNRIETWKVKKKKTYLFFKIFHCFKIVPVHKSKENIENHRFFDFFWRRTQVLTHQFFQRLAQGLRPHEGVVQRDHTQGTTIGKHNGETKRETGEKHEKWKKNNIFLFQYISLL